jgi:hypothetical protein
MKYIRDAMAAWLASGDPELEKAARHRLALLPPEDSTDDEPRGQPEPPKLPPLPDNPAPAPGVRLGGCCN